MVDLAQQHLALGGKRGIAVARGVDLGLGLVAGLANHRLPDRAVDGDMEQRDEIALHILDQVIGRAGLQRGDGDRGILRGGDEHHRRRIRDRQDPLQRFEAVEAGHVLIERDDVDAALLQPFQPLGAARRHGPPLKPSRVRPRSTSRASAASSSMYSSVGMGAVMWRLAEPE